MQKIILLYAIASISLISASSSLSREEILHQLSQERYFPYQDVIINNEVLAIGVGPDCASRYEAIKGILEKYKRPIKVLDLGASNGYFSLKIAHDFDALCVMVDVSSRLCDICRFNDKISGIVYLKRALSLEDLIILNQLEHFDVVLALNVVHHMSPYKEILDLIFELGDTVIIETPPANDARTEKNPDVPLIEKYLLEKQNGKVIAHTPRAEANNFEEITTLLNIEHYLTKKEYTPDAYAKMFCFENVIISKEKPSFKLETYCLLNGVFPLINDKMQLDGKLSLEV